MRPWFGSAVLACAIHSFLGGGNKQPVELLADEDGDYPASVVDAQIDEDRFWRRCEVRDVRYLVAISGKADVADIAFL